MKYIIDSYVWIEYLRGTYSGLEDIQSIIELEEICLPTLIIAEIKRAYVRDKTAGFDEDFAQMKSYDNIQILENLKEIVAIQAGELRSRLAPFVKTKKKPLSLVDCILLSIAIEIDAKVLSGDEHFGIIAKARRYDFPEELQYLENYVIYNGGEN